MKDGLCSLFFIAEKLDGSAPTASEHLCVLTQAVLLQGDAARAAGRSPRGPPLRHADQLAPTHGRLCLNWIVKHIGILADSADATVVGFFQMVRE